MRCQAMTLYPSLLLVFLIFSSRNKPQPPGYPGVVFWILTWKNPRFAVILLMRGPLISLVVSLATNLPSMQLCVLVAWTDKQRFWKKVKPLSKWVALTWHFQILVIGTWPTNESSGTSSNCEDLCLLVLKKRSSDLTHERRAEWYSSIWNHGNLKILCKSQGHGAHCVKL